MFRERKKMTENVLSKYHLKVVSTNKVNCATTSTDKNSLNGNLKIVVVVKFKGEDWLKI
jgi:hypothetical protein